MPEGDTVYRVAQRLDQRLKGLVVSRSDFRVPRHALADLSGRRTLGVVSRGKHLLHRFEDGVTLHSHLRMDGAWRTYDPGTPWTGGRAWTIRVILETDKVTAVGYRLPVVELLSTTQESRALGHLGPDLLGPDWDAQEAVRRLRAAPDRPLVEALLDQRNLAGIGNLYADELCFLARTSPWTPVGEVEELAGTVETAHDLLTRNAGTGIQSTTGSVAPGSTTWVYARADRACRRCATRIRRRPGLGGVAERDTWYCPGCQSGPVPASVRRPR